MKKILILLIFASFSLWASPEKIEVFFLSEQKAAALLEFIDKKSTTMVYSALAQVDSEEVPFDCIPMGEGCFHPQLGYIADKPAILNPTPKEAKPEGMESQTFQSLDVDLVECREGEYFDIFCGKAKKKTVPKKADIEIWFDVSTSMRKTDYSADLDRCYRRTFAEVLEKKCDHKPNFSVFNTGLKSIVDLSQICLLQGTNNTDRIVEWIKSSKAKHLIIITDTEEYTGALRDLLAVENSILHGLDAVNLYSENLLKYTDKLLSTCKK